MPLKNNLDDGIAKLRTYQDTARARLELEIPHLKDKAPIETGAQTLFLLKGSSEEKKEKGEKPQPRISLNQDRVMEALAVYTKAGTSITDVVTAFQPDRIIVQDTPDRAAVFLNEILKAADE